MQQEIKNKLDEYRATLDVRVLDFNYKEYSNYFEISYKIDKVSYINFVEIKDAWIDDYNALVQHIEMYLNIPNAYENVKESAVKENV